MKNIFLIFLLIGCSFSTISQVVKDNATLRAEFEARITMPENGRFPYQAFDQANKTVDNIFIARKSAKPSTAIPNIYWAERGPFNIGGRTRSIMYANNTTNKVWAGSVSGGLWYNNDITSSVGSWIKVDDFWENLSVTSIAKANNNTFYVATGERRKGGGPASRGGGIWKTVDAGASWFQLPKTNPSVDGNFYFIQKIVVSGTGKIYAACNGGLMTSIDGGDNWAKISDGYFDDVEMAPFNIVVACRRNAEHSEIQRFSASDVLTDVTPTYTGNGQRIELALAPSTAGTTLTIYAVCINGDPTSTSDILWFKKSTNAGVSWADITIPIYGASNNSFTNNGGGNQGDYDLAMAVHPSDPNLVIVGGVTNARTINGGSTWVVANYGANMHPDIHTVVFSPLNSNQVLIGNDGGVNYSGTYGDATATISTTAPGSNFASRNIGFRVTEFYKAAQKNVANDFYTLAGAQDNGTIKMNEFLTNSNGTEAGCCDGMNCYIDQDDPNIQILSTQNCNHYLHNPSTGANTNLLVKPNGQGFLNPTDYDSQNNIFWAYFNTDTPNNQTNFYKISGVGSTLTEQSFAVNDSIFPIFIKAGKTANTIFVGGAYGRLYKIVANPATNSSTFTDISPPSDAGVPYSWAGESLFSLEIGATEQELIVIKSNYGYRSVFYSTTGGTTWINKDQASHGLPDMPIFSALFNPLNRKQVLLATELGVWSTMDITASNPDWQPTTASLAHVRCMGFEYRSADNTVLVATFGRGVFFTKLNQPCFASISTFTLPSTGSGHFESASSITSFDTMPKGVIYLDATTNIKFTNGFKVNAGTHLKAYIDGCGGVR
jgi:hypothetical protein